MPTFDFDVSNPTNTAIVSAYPANERTQRGQVEAWAQIEHTLAGRHVIPSGNQAARDGLSDKAAGVWFLDIDSGLLERYDGAAWESRGFYLPGDMKVTAYDPSSPPRNWLVCDGQAVSTTTYAELFSVLGSVWNVDTFHSLSDPGAGLFRVPHMGQRYPAGYHQGSGEDEGTFGAETGEKSVALDGSEAPTIDSASGDHTHTTDATADLVAAFSGGGGVAVQNTHTHDIPSSGAHGHSYDAAGAAHENRPPSLVIGWVIFAGTVS